MKEKEEKTDKELEKEVKECLKKVKDVEYDIDVVSLGLIRKIESKGDKLYVVMTLTTPSCIISEETYRRVKDALEKEFKNKFKEIIVKLSLSPPWKPEDMSEEAKEKLGMF